jgi:hypothetical protein
VGTALCSGSCIHSCWHSVSTRLPHFPWLTFTVGCTACFCTQRSTGKNLNTEVDSSLIQLMPKAFTEEVTSVKGSLMWRGLRLEPSLCLGSTSCYAYVQCRRFHFPCCRSGFLTDQESVENTLAALPTLNFDTHCGQVGPHFSCHFTGKLLKCLTVST